MEKLDFQDRVAEAIKALGGQNAAKRAIKLRYGKGPSQQTLGYLVRKTGKKRAGGSVWIAQIAACAGMNPEWLASGEGPKMADAVIEQPRAVNEVVGDYSSGKKRRLEAKVYLEKQIDELVNAWLALNEIDRTAFKTVLEKVAIHQKAAVPDERLTKDWSRPSPTTPVKRTPSKVNN